MIDPTDGQPNGEASPHEMPGHPEATGESQQANSYQGDPDELHDLFAVNAAGTGEPDDPLAALRDDPNYSALIRDLEYIAKQARLLFEPAEEVPSDRVWDKIQKELGKASDA